MLQAETLQFLTELKENNNKPWFDENRKTYETARKNFVIIVETLIKGISKFDKSIEEANLQAKDCMFRINRDIRFSKNKEPYKTNFGASFSKGGKKAHSAGYYLHIEPTECFVAGGIWMPEPEDLKKIRVEIDYSFEEFNGIVNTPAFKKVFPSGLDREAFTARPPKGYDEENPAIEFIKLKSFTASSNFESKESLKSDFIENVLEKFKAMHPYIEFLNRAVEG
ncbi:MULTISPECIES: DUF2461 domain-containing protein [Emticicia]|uniref:DUF2461 domain-containing protein n=1 Tax=Emticicia TaxID=312278 RepID=UPI0007D8BD56|nr:MULTISPECIES: DUF2461 domain-containing protein [Emticicia]